ncbi:hypothetical protein BDF19DRAFT_411022 [Syncephalis fuscata]|nr:hypothetical protein BDF19DRAFT_411022 [Syncephalis fuscata]
MRKTSERRPKRNVGPPNWLVVSPPPRPTPPSIATQSKPQKPEHSSAPTLEKSEVATLTNGENAQTETIPIIKRKRGRPRLDATSTVPKIKRPVGRPPKVKTDSEIPSTNSVPNNNYLPPTNTTANESTVSLIKRRGRPPKIRSPDDPIPPKRPVGRPRKITIDSPSNSPLTFIQKETAKKLKAITLQKSLTKRAKSKTKSSSTLVSINNNSVDPALLKGKKSSMIAVCIPPISSTTTNLKVAKHSQRIHHRPNGAEQSMDRITVFDQQIPRKRHHLNDNSEKNKQHQHKSIKSNTVATKKPRTVFNISAAIATITATNTGHSSRDKAILERRTLLTKSIENYNRQLCELFHLETKRNMFLYDEEQLLANPSTALQEFMEQYSLQSLLSADAVRAVSVSSQRAVTRRSLRTHQEMTIGDTPSTTVLEDRTSRLLNASNSVMANTNEPTRPGATVRIAPAYGSLEAFLESFTFFDDDAIAPQEANHRAQKDAYVMNRASRVSDLPAQAPRIIFPTVPGPESSRQSALLALAKPRLKAMRAQRQRQSHLRGVICRAIERVFEEKRSKEEREQQDELKRRRQLSRQIAAIIRKSWKPIEQAVRDKHKIKELERERERGQQHLNKILEHSSRILAVRQSSVSSHEGDDASVEYTDTMMSELDEDTTTIMMATSSASSSPLVSAAETPMTSDAVLFEEEEEEEGYGYGYEEHSDTSIDLLTALDYQPLPTTTVSPVSSPSSVSVSTPSSPLIGKTTTASTTTESSELALDKKSLAPITISITEQPFLLRHKLRSYQLDGLRWLVDLHNKGLNGILADEMGLGKTIQTIALLAYLAGNLADWGPHLIVVPTSVLLNWTVEFQKWCPGFKVVTYYGSTKERKEKRRGWSADNAFHVCITTYQLVLQDQAIFRRRRWSYLVLDEAHKLKTLDHSVGKLYWDSNNLTELWSLLYFLMPDGVIPSEELGFASQREFHEWFGRPIDQIIESTQGPTNDSRAITGKYEHTVWCRLAKRQRQLYDDFMARARTRETLASGSYMSIINCLMQLRKVCNHPDLFEARPVTTSFPMADIILREGEALAKQIERWQHQWSSYQLDEQVAYWPGWPGLCERELHSKDDVNSNDATTALVASLSMPSIPLRQHQHDSYTSLLAHHLYATEQAIHHQVERWQALDRLNEQRCSSKRFNNNSTLLLDQFSQQLQRNLIQSLNDRVVKAQDMIDRFTFVIPTTTVRPDRVLIEMTSIETIEDIHCKARTSLTTDPLYPIRARQYIGFPDKRLLQYDCGKLQVLDQLLRQLKSEGHRTLIFTQMTRMLDILEAFLNMHGYRYLRLDGATKVEQRQSMTERFNADDRIFAFILSTRSGGIGINLTGADSVIFYDSDWNPFMDKQCQDRCHRIGQTRDVHIYRLVSEHTIESNILRKANQKRLLDNVVIQEGDFTTDFFSRVGWRDALGLDETDPMATDAILPDLPDNLDVALAEVEDEADVAALKQARKEADDVDLADRADYKESTNDQQSSSMATESSYVTANTPSSTQPTSPAVSVPISEHDDHSDREEEEEEEPGDIEEYMLRQAEWNFSLLE